MQTISTESLATEFLKETFKDLDVKQYIKGNEIVIDYDDYTTWVGKIEGTSLILERKSISSSFNYLSETFSIKDPKIKERIIAYIEQNRNIPSEHPEEGHIWVITSPIFEYDDNYYYQSEGRGNIFNAHTTQKSAVDTEIKVAISNLNDFVRYI